jgi:hypothetical protein
MFIVNDNGQERYKKGTPLRVPLTFTKNFSRNYSALVFFFVTVEPTGLATFGAATFLTTPVPAIFARRRALALRQALR